MESLIKIYGGNPTAGDNDGTVISSGDGSNPIHSGPIIIPESGFAEGDWVKLAVRCDDGYETTEYSGAHATVSIEDGDAVTLWQLAHDDNGTPDTPMDWGDPLEFDNKVGSTNTIFWVRARAESGSLPVNDTSVKIPVQALIAAS